LQLFQLRNYLQSNLQILLQAPPCRHQLKSIDAAYKNGCKRFDGAIRGYGGCPMAKDDLTGNMPTENLIYYFNNAKEDLNLDQNAFQEALDFAVNSVFPEKSFS
jgi:hydroxymethylglutaryl-CoA lyase